LYDNKKALKTRKKSMKNLNVLDWIALILIIIGGINWGLIGLFNYNLVGSILGGNMSAIARIVYVLVGISAVYYIVVAANLSRK
jgi:hypothetical protein